MQPICLQIPPEIAAQIKLPPKRAQRVLMEELVLRLYEEGIISAGQGVKAKKKGTWMDALKGLNAHNEHIECQYFTSESAR